MFWGLWLVGSALNILVVCLPLLLLDEGLAVVWDVRFLGMLAILHLWVGCDHSIPAKGIRYYRDVRVEQGGRIWFPLVSGLLVLLSLWIAVFDGANGWSDPLHPFATASGLCIALVGLWLRFSAITHLGRFFTEELKVLTFQPLVKHGPYAIIRHPSYTGLLLILLGINITLESPWGLLFVTVVMIPMVLVRVILEERMMVDGFGDLFLEYQDQTKRLVPAIW